MIKDVTIMGHDHEHYEVYCDSCPNLIAECWNWEWEGKPLMYSPILCEDCGIARSKDHGDKTKRVEELEKQLAKLKESLK